MECKDISMLTRTEKYSVIWLEDMSFSSISMATSGLFSTRSGSLAGVRPMWYTSFGSFSNSARSYEKHKDTVDLTSKKTNLTQDISDGVWS